MKTHPNLHKALKKIKKAKTDNQIKMVIADYICKSACCMALVDEAEDFYFEIKTKK
jgi:hypothetical protein